MAFTGGRPRQHAVSARQFGGRHAATVDVSDPIEVLAERRAVRRGALIQARQVLLTAVLGLAVLAVARLAPVPGQAANRTSRAQLDLGLPAGPALVLLAGLLTVVVVLNLTLALAPSPSGSRDRIRLAEWQNLLALTAKACAAAAIVVAVAAGLSTAPVTLGIDLGLAALALASLTLAAAGGWRASEYLSGIIELYEHRTEQQRLAAAVARHRLLRPSKPVSAATAILGCAFAALIVGLLSTSMVEIALTAEHRLGNVATMWVLLAVSVGAAGVQFWLGFASWKAAALADTWPRTRQAGLQLLWCAGWAWLAALQFARAEHALLAGSYLLLTAALPFLLVAADRWLSWLGATMPLRVLVERSLTRRYRAVLGRSVAAAWDSTPPS